MDCRWSALAVLHVQHCRWSQKPQVVARTASAHKIDCLQLQHWQCLPHAHQHNILNILHSCQMAASRRASDPRPAPQLGSTPPPSSLCDPLSRQACKATSRPAPPRLAPPRPVSQIRPHHYVPCCSPSRQRALHDEAVAHWVLRSESYHCRQNHA